jgi:hypothetical protein
MNERIARYLTPGAHDDVVSYSYHAQGNVVPDESTLEVFAFFGPVDLVAGLHLNLNSRL